MQALANILIVGTVVVLLGGGAYFGLRFGLDRVREGNAATAQAVATSNAKVIASRTARALEGTAVAATTVAATPASPAPLASIGTGSVVAGGNLRSEPVVSPETVIGQICPGDQIDFLEQRSGADGSLWYHIRVTEVVGACTPQHVTMGSLGWASSTLLSPLATP
jgi:hypothetical protein